jgi:hypothetical protein
MAGEIGHIPGLGYYPFPLDVVGNNPLQGSAEWIIGQGNGRKWI